MISHVLVVGSQSGPLHFPRRLLVGLASNVDSSTGDIRPLADWMAVFSVGEFVHVLSC